MNKFGMFIHWGLYALTEQHEQALARYQIPFDEYETLAKKFNPTEYNPEEWVLLAKNAGMKYICFTTKHHDGFCMWDTKYTDYNVMNSPYGKDVLKMLADACKKHGMLLSLYYSNPDWYHENAYNENSTHQWRAKYPEKSDLDAYRTYIKNQLKELLSNYGEIYTLFWDIPPKVEDPSMNEFVRSLQPNILINDRGWDAGDFSTPERSVPDGAHFERMTEACQSVGEQAWGYRADEDYYSASFLMSSIDKIMAMGGSYLLNVGPMPNGKIPEQAIKLIEKVGNWYKRMQDALENHVADEHNIALVNNKELVVTYKDGKTYLHLYKGVTSTGINFSLECEFKPKKARLLNSNTELKIRSALLPHYMAKDGTAKGPFTSITEIPCDDYVGEPLIIELEW